MAYAAHPSLLLVALTGRPCPRPTPSRRGLHRTRESNLRADAYHVSGSGGPHRTPVGQRTNGSILRPIHYTNIVYSEDDVAEVKPDTWVSWSNSPITSA